MTEEEATKHTGSLEHVSGRREVVSIVFEYRDLGSMMSIAYIRREIPDDLKSKGTLGPFDRREWSVLTGRFVNLLSPAEKQ